MCAYPALWSVSLLCLCICGLWMHVASCQHLSVCHHPCDLCKFLPSVLEKLLATQQNFGREKNWTQNFFPSTSYYLKNGPAGLDGSVVAAPNTPLPMLCVAIFM